MRDKNHSVSLCYLRDGKCSLPSDTQVAIMYCPFFKAWLAHKLYITRKLALFSFPLLHENDFLKQPHPLSPITQDPLPTSPTFFKTLTARGIRRTLLAKVLLNLRSAYG